MRRKNPVGKRSARVSAGAKILPVRSDVRGTLSAAAALTFASALWTSSAAGPGRAIVKDVRPLSALARIGPWPAVSALIGYRGRLWFVNSVKHADHNSADLYSYDPKSGDPRYERHLFSQDAGRPAVSGGLLYWPFEDARFSVGRGEFMLTNGRDWQWRSLPYPRVLHLHTMLSHRGILYAGAGGRRPDPRR